MEDPSARLSEGSPELGEEGWGLWGELGCALNVVSLNLLILLRSWPPGWEWGVFETPQGLACVSRTALCPLDSPVQVLTPGTSNVTV